MAGADMILKKILDDAKTEAAATLTEAQDRAQVLRARSQANVETSRRTAMEKARSDAEQRRDRRLRMALLDARKEQLAMKRELIDEAFERTLDKLMKADASMKTKLFQGMLLVSAQGGETILPAKADAALFTADFLAKVNGELSKAGKAPVTVGETADIRGGFILSLGGMECNCSLEALIRQERDGLEPEVARVLFPTKEG